MSATDDRVRLSNTTRVTNVVAATPDFEFR
jgi:hypothetical protein